MKLEDEKKSFVEIVIEQVKDGRTFVIDWDRFPDIPYICPRAEDCEKYEGYDGGPTCAPVDCPEAGKWVFRMAGRSSKKFPHRGVLIDITTNEEGKDRIINTLKELDP